MQLTRLLPALRRRLHAEDGFTMLLAIAALLIASLLVTASLVAAEGDTVLTHRDTAEKKAYHAAQAGIDDYFFHLNRNSNYWQQCTSGTEAVNNKALNQVGSTKARVKVPGASEEEYAIQLLPATTSKKAECSTTEPTQTMIEQGNEAGGTFRIESTGYSGPKATCEKTGSSICAKRSIVATFSNGGFLNYVYYTKYETTDPNTYTPAKPSCAAYRASRPSSCANISFVEGDKVLGPIHTEDTAQVCRKPTFGRSSSDLIEFRGGGTGSQWVGAGCSGDSVNMVGTFVAQSKVKEVQAPPSNESLQAIASTTYEGKTTIALNGTTMEVTNGGVTKTNVAWPTNGVIYVSNKSCGVTQYTPYNPTYTEDSGCGNVYISGTYEKSLTIAAENDIVIKGSLKPPVSSGKPTTGAVLGLIADNFVRIYHPLTGSRGSEDGECGPWYATAENATGSIQNPEIYAAILALNHSFIVDNFDCGNEMGTLKVFGAIAQEFRGTVGTNNNGVIESGYTKYYEYDDRLAYESPPYFLNPVKAAWKIRRETLAPSL